jgi:hypothetical protein
MSALLRTAIALQFRDLLPSSILDVLKVRLRGDAKRRLRLASKLARGRLRGDAKRRLRLGSGAAPRSEGPETAALLPPSRRAS